MTHKERHRRLKVTIEVDADVLYHVNPLIGEISNLQVLARDFLHITDVSAFLSQASREELMATLINDEAERAAGGASTPT